MYKKLTFGLTVVLLAIGITHSAKATLLGQEVTCSSPDFNCSSSSAVVDPLSSEFVLGDDNGRDLFGIDIGGSTVRITNIFPFDLGPPLSGFSFNIGDLFWAEDPTAQIIGIDLISQNIGATVAFSSGLSGNELEVEFADIDSWVPGEFAEFTLIPEPHASEVPEPGAFWLFGFGLALIFWWTRRTRSLASGHRDRDHTLIGRDRPSPYTAIALGGLGFMMRRHRRYAQEGLS